MASLGAKVLQIRSVEMAHGAQGAAPRALELRRSGGIDRPMGPRPGTLVCDEDEIMEKQIVSGVAFADEAKITLRDVKDQPGVAAAIFGPLADGRRQRRHDRAEHLRGRLDHRHHLHRARRRVRQRALRGAGGRQAGPRSTIDRLDGANDVAKVSVVGIGMRSHAGVAATMFKALADKGINIQVITTSEIKISVLIDAEYAELAVRRSIRITGWTNSERANSPHGPARPWPTPVARASRIAALACTALVASAIAR